MYSLGLRGAQIDHNSDFQILIAGLEKAGWHVPGWIKENYCVLQDWASSSWDGRSVIATLEQIEEVIPILEKWDVSSTLEERNPGNPLYSEPVLSPKQSTFNGFDMEQV